MILFYLDNGCMTFIILTVWFIFTHLNISGQTAQFIIFLIGQLQYRIISSMFLSSVWTHVLCILTTRFTQRKYTWLHWTGVRNWSVYSPLNYRTYHTLYIEQLHNTIWEVKWIVVMEWSDGYFMERGWNKRMRLVVKPWEWTVGTDVREWWWDVHVFRELI